MIRNNYILVNMRMSVRISIFLKATMLIAVITSCRDRNNQDYLEYFTINAAENRIEKLNSSHYIDTSEINIIRLETTEKSLFGEVTKLVRTESRIFILDATHAKCILIFDTAGNFQNSIGSIGRGPGELSYLLDFSVDPDEEYIIITDNTGKILKTDLEGNIIKESNLKWGSLTNVICHEGNIYGYTGSRAGMGNYQIIKLNSELDFEQAFLPFSSPLPGLFRNMNALYKFAEEVFFYSIIDNCIYHLQDGIFVKRYYFDFGELNLTLNNSSSPEFPFGSEFAFLWNFVVEGDSIVLLSVFDDGRPWLSFLSKRDNELYTVTSVNEDLPGFSRPITHFKGMFISVCESSQFIEAFPLSDFSPKPEDNPLLIEYRIKADFNFATPVF